MRTYLILPGNTFRADDGSLLQGGDTLLLADDAAALHAGKIVPAEPAAEPAAQPAPAAPDA